MIYMYINSVYNLCRLSICGTVFLLHGSSSFCDIRSNETPEALLCLCQRATLQFTPMAIVCNCFCAKHVTGNIEPKRRSKIAWSSPVSLRDTLPQSISTRTPFHCSVITPTSHYQPFQSSSFTLLGDAMVIKSHIKKLKPYQPPLEGRNPQKYMLLEPNL